MNTILLIIHSVLRYAILILLLAAIFRAFSGWFGNKPFTEGTRKLNLFTLIFAHVQLLVGLGNYFMSTNVQIAFSNMGEAMKDKELRYWAVEHIAMMVIAITLITLGYSLSKKGKTDEAKHKRAAIFFTIALLVILYAIPWPWSAISRGWMPQG
jgi:uncharacterized membrane protein YozB (DUF420 family)